MHAAILVILSFAISSLAWAQALPDSAEGRSCEQPVLWIAQYGPDEFAQPYCDGCLPGRGETCAAEVRERGKHVIGRPAEHSSPEETRIELGACQLASAQHQLIRAWYGRPVEQAWKGVLRKSHDWVGERPRVSYPQAAVPVLRELTQVRKACRELENKHAKYLARVDQFVRSGKAKRPIASEDDGWGGPGLTARLLWGGSSNPVRATLRVYDEPQILGQIFNENGDASRSYPKGFTPGLTKTWRSREYVAVVSYYERGGGFRCWGECEGGYSLDVFVDASGAVVGQMASMSACPFVYTAPSGSVAFVQQGEILRNLRRPELETTQTLGIVGEAEGCMAGALTVRITEEKDEVTYLDDVSLLVGDILLKPSACEDSPAYCADDGDYVVLNEGEVLELEFKIPDDQRGGCGDLVLMADGYYVPGEP